MRWIILSGVFSIVWFLTLFCLLPIGLGGGADPETGAPLEPRLLLKAGIATLVAIIGCGVFYVFVVSGLVDV